MTLNQHVTDILRGVETVAHTHTDAVIAVIVIAGIGCLVLVVDNGLMTEEQKSEYLENDSFTVSGYFKPEIFMTLNDIVDKVEDSNGMTYDEVGKYQCFIGTICLYRGNGA